MRKVPEASTCYAISGVRKADPRKRRLVLGCYTTLEQVEDFLAHKPSDWSGFRIHSEYKTFTAAINGVEKS